MGVAHVMESHLGQVGSGHYPVERLGERVGVYRPTLVVSEHPTLRLDASHHLLVSCQSRQAEKTRRVAGARSTRRRELLVLHRVSWSLCPTANQTTVDRYGGNIEVDVMPFESEEFAAPESCVGDQLHGREQPMSHRRAEKRLQLVGGPCLLFHLWYRTQFGGVGNQSHVPGYETLANCVVEGSPDDEMSLQYRLRRQRFGSVAGVELVVVEPFQMMVA